MEGAHHLRSVTLCSALHVRGVYTSDNDYDFVTLPQEMRFKFGFESQITQKWPEYFDWFAVPCDNH